MGSFLIGHMEVRHSLLYYVLLIKSIPKCTEVTSGWTTYNKRVIHFYTFQLNGQCDYPKTEIDFPAADTDCSPCGAVLSL